VSFSNIYRATPSVPAWHGSPVFFCDAPAGQEMQGRTAQTMEP